MDLKQIRERLALRQGRIEQNLDRLNRKLADRPDDPKVEAWTRRKLELELSLRQIELKTEERAIEARLQNPGNLTIEIPTGEINVSGHGPGS